LHLHYQEYHSKVRVLRCNRKSILQDELLFRSKWKDKGANLGCKPMKRVKMWPFLLLCGVFCFVPSSSIAQESRAVPLPSVTGPIPVTATSHPMNGAGFELKPEDLSTYDYVEEEYFLSGKANVYSEDDDGKVSVKASDAPYTTRILVRHPRDPKKFSGNVITGPMNPSTNVDLLDPWMNARRYITEHGDVYVGMTAKPVAIVSLKKFDPERYKPLTMTNPNSESCPNPAAGTPLVGFLEPVPGMENGLVWDMLSQLGALLKSDSTPVKGFKARYVYMSGGSQTGGFTIRYINSFHQRAKLPNGKPIYDGYIPFIAAGMSPINQCSKWASLSGDPDPKMISRNITTDAGVPVIRIMSQTDFGGSSHGLGRPGIALRLRQPDSDDPKNPYRLYEVPGTSHVVQLGLDVFPRAEDMLKSGNQPFVYDCAEPVPIDGEMFTSIFDGAFANLDRWVRTGKVPPKADRITTEGDLGVNDEFGNMKGGVRTPDVDVPIGTYVEASTATKERGAGGGCNAMGHINLFTAERLKQLYPTHADYVKKVDKDVDRMLAEGWLTASDAAQIKEHAAKADVPPGGSN
jgi:hypothetical protein